MAELTTTSYALLALLAVRPFTTYQLAKQMERSLRDVWPRAESVIYEEPKRLVARGLARAAVDFTGRRSSTTYSITPEGRASLRRWLAEPGAGPSFEFEGLLKVAFADIGELDGLRRNLEAIRVAAEERAAYIGERTAEYEQTGGPFPERLPIIMLTARFFEEQTAALVRWVTWAEEEVATWTGVTPPTGARVPGPDGSARRGDGTSSGRRPTPRSPHAS